MYKRCFSFTIYYCMNYPVLHPNFWLILAHSIFCFLTTPRSGNFPQSTLDIFYPHVFLKKSTNLAITTRALELPLTSLGLFVLVFLYQCYQSWLTCCPVPVTNPLTTSLLCVHSCTSCPGTQSHHSPTSLPWKVPSNQPCPLLHMRKQRTNHITQLRIRKMLSTQAAIFPVIAEVKRPWQQPYIRCDWWIL